MKTQLLLYLLLNTLIGLGQNAEKIGKINLESSFYLGSNFLIQGGILSESNSYNDFTYSDTVSTIMQSAKLLKGKSGEYEIGVLASYPHPFQITYFDEVKQVGVSSHYFFIGNRNVSLKLADLFKEKNLLFGKPNKENREYLNLQNLYSKFINKQTGEIYNLAGKLEIIKQYIIRNRNSIIALWDLALNYHQVRSEIDKRKVLNTIQFFSPKVKDTKTFQALSNNIIKDLELVEGKRMPNFFLNGNFSNDSLLSIVSKNKYTLVDFWFSNCMPCIAQFPYYKQIYDSNKVNGFEIVGISVDTKTNETNWRSTITKFKLNWLQFLDKNGSETEKLFISKFPTNFLLDKTGVIVKKDISPEELDLFLKKN